MFNCRYQGGSTLKKAAITSGFILFLSFQAIGQGTTGFEIMRSEISSRGAAMAGAMVAMETGLDGLFYNPAALGSAEKRNANLTYLKHLLDIESGFIGYSQPVKDYGTIAAGINYINFGRFDEATAFGELTGNTFRAADLQFTLGYGKKILEWMSAGVSVKYVRSEIWDVTSSAAAFDAGGLIYTPFDNVKIGFGIYNLGKTLNGYYDYKDELPLGYKLGFSKPLAHLPLEIALQVDKFKDSDLYLSAGGEFTISEMFRLRAGWSTKGADQRVDGNSDVLAGVSFGLGLRTSGVIFDYSMSSWGELGTLTRVTIGGEF